MAGNAALDGAVDHETVARFHAQGFAVLREVFDPSGLATEVDDALHHGLRPGSGTKHGAGGVEFCSVVMMCERTPVALALVDALAPLAAALLGRPVLPGRAKGTRYFGSSELHRDSDVAIPSLGFLAYLEPVGATTGALRVVPGSHRLDAGGALPPARALATTPGDLVVFDEHLIHGSTGGADRRQWRADFIADPTTPDEEARFRSTFERLFDPSWDGGDDVDRYPSYGPYWQALDRPWNARLRRLGVYHLAARCAATVRTRRAPQP
jgi:hypothetical protein